LVEGKILRSGDIICMQRRQLIFTTSTLLRLCVSVEAFSHERFQCGHPMLSPARTARLRAFGLAAGTWAQTSHSRAWTEGAPRSCCVISYRECSFFCSLLALVQTG